MGKRMVRRGPRIFPRKGSKQREILKLMLRPCGVTSSHAMNYGLINSRDQFGTILVKFINELNLDIVSWTLKGDGHTKMGRRGGIVAYRLIGRWAHDGKYLDYLARKF